MEQSQPQPIKTILAIAIVLLIIGISYIFIAKNNVPGEVSEPISEDKDNQEPITVVVNNTPMVNGIIPAPAGFPTDIPFENNSLIESATTRYPEHNAEQLSLSYKSSKTIAEKYTEYKNYMNQVGYDLAEGDSNSIVRALFGTKEDANLSVAISSSEGQTLVQLSYLLKSVN